MNQHATAVFVPPRVVAIKAYTKQLNDRLAQREYNFHDLRDEGLYETYEGLRVVKPLVHLLREICIAMPTAKFGANQEYSHDQVAVYREGALHCMGVVGYGQFMQSSPSEYVYMIRSTRIRNSRYKSNTIMYNTMLTSSFARAAKIASAKLIPYTPEDDAAMSIYVPHKNLHSTLRRKNEALHNNATFGAHTIIDEMEHLIDCGVKFKTQAFQKLAEVFEDLMSDLRYERLRSTNMYYVWINEVRGTHWATVVSALNVRQNGGIVVDGPKQTFKVDDLPTDIAAKIATLSITEHNSYVEGLGVRLDDTHFWIERDDKGEE